MAPISTLPLPATGRLAAADDDRAGLLARQIHQVLAAYVPPAAAAARVDRVLEHAIRGFVGSAGAARPSRAQALLAALVAPTAGAPATPAMGPPSLAALRLQPDAVAGAAGPLAPVIRAVARALDGPRGARPPTWAEVTEGHHGPLPVPAVLCDPATGALWDDPVVDLRDGAGVAEYGVACKSSQAARHHVACIALADVLAAWRTHGLAGNRAAFLDEAGRALSCPILKCAPRRPVVMPDGQLYDREAIVQHLQGTPCSPVTKQAMGVSAVPPHDNGCLGALIADLGIERADADAVPELVPAPKGAPAPARCCGGVSR